jgi:hypothetical protein
VPQPPIKERPEIALRLDKGVLVPLNAAGSATGQIDRAAADDGLVVRHWCGLQGMSEGG